MLYLGLQARFYSACLPYQPLILLVGGAPSVRGLPNGIAFVPNSHVRLRCIGVSNVVCLTAF